MGRKRASEFCMFPGSSSLRSPPLAHTPVPYPIYRNNVTLTCMVKYTDSIDDIKRAMLEGFFKGWISPPSKEIHLKVLKNSYGVVLAVDDSHDKVAGFITAISDGVLSAHISLFEVLPDYHSKGLGKELLRRMLAKLNNLYAVSLMCDEELEPFYSRFGMSPGTGMNIRNYEKQSARQ